MLPLPATQCEKVLWRAGTLNFPGGYMTRMLKTIVGLVAGVLVAALLTACGSGSSSSSSTTAAPTPTLVGTFTDAPVAGLFYTTNSGSGGCTASAPCVTDAMGQFKYAAGDAVKFFAAGIYLGSASPSVAADGSTTVTPMSLVSGATSVTDSTVTTIASYLSALNAISVAKGQGASGVYVVPNDTALVNALSAVGTLTTTNLQTALNAVYPTLGIAVPGAAAAQAALQQGINSQGVIGTVWSGTCATCGPSGGSDGGVFYFQPNGALVGFTQSGATLSGSWAGLTSGGVSVSLVSSKGGYTQGGAIPTGSSAGSAQVYSSGGALQGTFNFTKTSSTALLTNTAYLGGWYATFTPKAAGTAAGYGTGGSAYFIAAPDGNLYGITNDGSYFSGTWNLASGVGTANVTTPGKTTAVSVALATGTGAATNNGNIVGSLAFSRTGSFSVTPGMGSANNIPLLLKVSVSWANTATSVSSFALSLNVLDANGNQVANGIKAESTSLRTDGTRTTTTDNIAVSYPQGGGSSYKLQVNNPALNTPCTVTSGSGTVNDANSGNAGAYPTVSISCN
jgi:hypothetical protein